MRTDNIFITGPHQWKIEKIPSLTEPGFIAQYVIVYNLFGCNGVTVNPRPGKPNAHGWVTSRYKWDTVREATIYARDFLLRPQDKEND